MSVYIPYNIYPVKYSTCFYCRCCEFTARDAAADQVCRRDRETLQTERLQESRGNTPAELHS